VDGKIPGTGEVGCKSVLFLMKGTKMEEDHSDQTSQGDEILLAAVENEYRNEIRVYESLTGRATTIFSIGGLLVTIICSYFPYTRIKDFYSNNCSCSPAVYILSFFLFFCFCSLVLIFISFFFLFHSYTLKKLSALNIDAISPDDSVSHPSHEIVSQLVKHYTEIRNDYLNVNRTKSKDIKISFLLLAIAAFLLIGSVIIINFIV
jgi:hypothetical protein